MGCASGEPLWDYGIRKCKPAPRLFESKHLIDELGNPLAISCTRFEMPVKLVRQVVAARIPHDVHLQAGTSSSARMAWTRLSIADLCRVASASRRLKSCASRSSSWTCRSRFCSRASAPAAGRPPTTPPKIDDKNSRRRVAALPRFVQTTRVATGTNSSASKNVDNLTTASAHSFVYEVSAFVLTPTIDGIVIPSF
jgi:hypothetical protein